MKNYNWLTGSSLPWHGRKTGLSPREVEIIQGLARGKTRAQMALELGISPNTIKSHLVRAYRFLGAANALDAFAKWQACTEPFSLSTPGSRPFSGHQVRLHDGRLLINIELAAGAFENPEDLP